MRTSGHWVSTSGRTPLAVSRKRSQTASLILSAAKFRLVSGLCCAVISTLMLCLGVNQCSHATGLGGAVQVLFAAVLGVGEQHQHALGQTAVQIEQHGVRKRGAHRHAATLLGDATRRQLRDPQDLGGQKVLHTGGAGEEESELIHENVEAQAPAELAWPGRWVRPPRAAKGGWRSAARRGAWGVKALIAPSSNSRARFSAPRGIWPRCGGRTRCPVP